MNGKIFGTTTMNDKGQVVIPVDARHTLNLAPGDRLIVMGGGHGKGLILLKASDVEALMKDFTASITQAMQQINEEEST